MSDNGRHPADRASNWLPGQRVAALKSSAARCDWRIFLTVSLISIALNLILHTSVRNSILSLYPGDSFHTLTPPAAAGLVIISAVIISFLLLASWTLTEFWVACSSRHSIIRTTFFFCVDNVVILILYATLLMLVPQLYYAYYHIVFENLPVQWVAKTLPLKTLARLVQLQPGGSMSDHLAGFTAWILICNLFIHWWLKKFIKPFPRPN